LVFKQQNYKKNNKNKKENKGFKIKKLLVKFRASQKNQIEQSSCPIPKRTFPHISSSVQECQAG
jgi:hypothetical protein